MWDCGYDMLLPVGGSCNGLQRYAALLHVVFTSDMGDTNINAHRFTRKAVLHLVWDDNIIRFAEDRLDGANVHNYIELSMLKLRIKVKRFNEMSRLSRFWNAYVNQEPWPIYDLANATFM
ncbi:bifunctional nuclease [Artemisia annua]|uniref:Bifunctional nuclease n=1 Tax=Artemisia annua TaxID=35608 RepID=A0A2U1KZC9_ARTAN|nr:bifunctional nuclease [Artemisia annua]